MSVDPKFGRYCDECGRVILKAHRIYKGQDYCSTCYPRVFLKKACSLCGKSARVHRLASSEPLCRACERLGRVCVRCAKPVEVAGMMSGDKPVCPSCVPYFREKRHCAYCGKPSARLSTMPTAGIQELICDSCRNEVTHKTCSVCRKYRKVEGMDDSGKPYCAACRPGAEVSHPCPSCAAAVPGAGASRCRSCLNHEALEREGRMAASSLTHEWVGRLEQRFAEWLHAREPDKPSLVKTYRSHHALFERLDAQFVVQADATAEAILQFFGTAMLRKHLLASQFLSEALGISFTGKLKSDASERDRIDDKLRQCRKKPWANVIDQYHASLSGAGLPLRTMRLYLATAVAFCETAEVKDQAWASPTLEKFLKRQPGVRNNLSKFVGYCRRAYGWEVEMPRRPSKRLPGGLDERLVRELSKLTHRVSSEGIGNVDARVLEKIIAKSLAFRISYVTCASNDQFIETAGKYAFRSGEELIAVPDELEPYFREYVSRRE